MDKSFTLMKIAAVAIIVAVVVAMSIMVTDGGKARFNKATRQMNSATSEFDNPALQAYDGATITGAEVIKAIDKYASKDLPIIVRTTVNKVGCIHRQSYNNPNLIGKDTAILKKDKINESAVFTGSLVRDTNGSITDVIFSQDSTTEIPSIYNLNGIPMTGEEAKAVINTYKTEISGVWLQKYEHGEHQESITKYTTTDSLAKIDPNSSLVCFVYTAGNDTYLQFIAPTDPQLKYDGAILTGQEVIYLMKNGRHGNISIWYTERCPEGYYYYAYWDDIVEKARINPDWKFRAEIAQPGRFWEGESIDGLNFYQIIE